MLGVAAFQIALIDELNDPLIGACWDTGHGNRPKFMNAGKDPSPESDSIDQYQNLVRLGKRLKALHVHDNNCFEDDHLIPYHGKICWDRVIAALDEIEYEQFFTFEAHNASARMCQGNMSRETVDTANRLLYEIGVDLVSKSKLK